MTVCGQFCSILCQVPGISRGLARRAAITCTFTVTERPAISLWKGKPMRAFPVRKEPHAGAAQLRAGAPRVNSD